MNNYYYFKIYLELNHDKSQVDTSLLSLIFFIIHDIRNVLALII